MAFSVGDEYWESEPVVLREFGSGSVSFEHHDGQEFVYDLAELRARLDALATPDPLERFAGLLGKGRRVA